MPNKKQKTCGSVKRSLAPKECSVGDCQYVTEHNESAEAQRSDMINHVMKSQAFELAGNNPDSLTPHSQGTITKCPQCGKVFPKYAGLSGFRACSAHTRKCVVSSSKNTRLLGTNFEDHSGNTIREMHKEFNLHSSVARGGSSTNFSPLMIPEHAKFAILEQDNHLGAFDDSSDSDSNKYPERVNDVTKLSRFNHQFSARAMESLRSLKHRHCNKKSGPNQVSKDVEHSVDSDHDENNLYYTNSEEFSNDENDDILHDYEAHQRLYNNSDTSGSTSASDNDEFDERCGNVDTLQCPKVLEDEDTTEDLDSWDCEDNNSRSSDMVDQEDIMLRTEWENSNTIDESDNDDSSDSNSGRSNETTSGNSEHSDNRGLPDHVMQTGTSPDNRIRTYIQEIRKHRKNVGINTEWIPYITLLKKLTKPGCPDLLYNEVAKEVERHWILAHGEKGRYEKSPSRHILTQWLFNTVHPKKYHDLARPQRKTIQLKSGRQVIVTYFDIHYQIALIFSDESIVLPENFIFPDINNPLELPDYDNIPLGDLNTGMFHEMTSKMLNTDGDTNQIVFPFLSFIDGTLVSRNSVEPITLCPGIFKSSVRNLDRSWFIIGYIEPASNYIGKVTVPSFVRIRGKKKKIPTKIKLNDYHSIISFCFEGFCELQRTGFYIDLPTTHTDERGDRIYTRSLVAVPVLQAVLSDTKAGNGFTGRFGSHGENVKGLVRDCDVKTKDGSKATHICNFFKKRFFRTKTEAEKKELSFHHIVNAFDKIWFGYCDKFGVYGATPPETLHVFYLGICEYLYEGFMNTLSGDMKIVLEELSKEMVFQNGRQGTDNLPNVDCYRHGISYGKLMITGKEKFARIFLIYLCLQNSEFVTKLGSSKKRRTKKSDKYEYTPQLVKQWFLLMEQTIALESWLRSPSHPRTQFFVTENNREGECYAQVKIRDYMKLYRLQVKRKKGVKLLLTKFHHLLHFTHYTRIHGAMVNFDGSRPESNGKELTKNPGSRTNNQVAILTYSIGKKWTESRLFVYFESMMASYRPHYARRFGIKDSWAEKNSNLKEEEAESSGPLQRIFTGSRFQLQYSNLNVLEGMTVKWTTKTDYIRLWDDQILLSVENKLFLPTINGNVNDGLVFSGFTEMKTFKKHKSQSLIYRAHPSYMSGKHWYSWAYVAWHTTNNEDEQSIFPAKIFMFFDTYNFSQRQLSQTGFCIEPDKVYAIVQSAHNIVSVSRENRLVGKLNKRFGMEKSLTIIDIENIVGVANVVEDDYLKGSDGKKSFLCNSISVINDTETFPNLFYT
jgi:hypothetical protein